MGLPGLIDRRDGRAGLEDKWVGEFVRWGVAMEHLGVEFKGFVGEPMSGEASYHHIPSEGVFDWGSLEGELSRVHVVVEGVEGGELVCCLEGLWGLGFDD